MASGRPGGLEIRPHSRRISALAVAGLAAVSALAFAAGLHHQLNRNSGPSPFPPSRPAQPELIVAAPPEVAPLLPAKLTPPVRRAVASAADAGPGAVAAGSAAADIAAVAPETPPSAQPASPRSEEPPPT